MGAAAQLVFGGNLNAYAIAFGLFSLFLQIYLPYRQYVVATAFVVHVPWLEAIRATIIPVISWKAEYWMALVAVLGTTISPYLFFWQTSEEAEDVRVTKSEFALKRRPSQAVEQFHRIEFDTWVGMALSNLIAFFIILTTAVTLHVAGSYKGIETSADAAKALEPLAGHFAFLLFALGIIGTGLLAVPVLAGSAAYAVAETFRWRASLESKPKQARKFYIVIAAATLIGVCLNFLGMNPIRALYWSAVLNGIVAVPLMVMLMIMSSNNVIVGKFHLPLYLRTIGWAATGIMFLASLGFLLSILR
jgi:Mn2+/Fe2+ NRAMP family transporter